MGGVIVVRTLKDGVLRGVSKTEGNVSWYDDEFPTIGFLPTVLL